MKIPIELQAAAVLKGIEIKIFPATTHKGCFLFNIRKSQTENKAYGYYNKNTIINKLWQCISGEEPATEYPDHC